MKIYYWFYRSVMQLAHRYDWHYAPIIGPFEDGSKQYWCKWCGLRDTIPINHPIPNQFGPKLLARPPMMGTFVWALIHKKNRAKLRYPVIYGVIFCLTVSFLGWYGIIKFIEWVAR